jgi:hypothetical protein
MGLKSPKSILLWESLDGGRRTNAERRDKPKRWPGDSCGYDQSPADKERDKLTCRTVDNTSMGYRTDRTLMAGKLGIVCVYVDSLNHAGEGDQQDAD